jgi:hypothetical protein
VPPVAAQTFPQAASKAKKASKFRLTVDVGVLADTNITNSNYDAQRTGGSGAAGGPIIADQPRSGIGRSVGAAAALRVPVTSSVALAVDADVYALDYDGRFADDAGASIAAGAEIKIDGHTQALVQATASDRWYGHVLANSAAGVRGQIRHQVAEGQQLTLSVDARVLNSDYGEVLGGHELGVTATYDITLNPNTTLGLGAYGRRDWLKGAAYANTDIGTFAALNRYLGDHFLLGIYGGLSRARYDAADPYLSPNLRSDWRWYGGVSLTTRKPLLLGVFPNLSYTYSHTASTVPVYRADRHRARLGLRRSF